MSTSAATLARRLLAWYDGAARDLPWRVSPQARRHGERPDPYRVWLSEIMLQQTTVAAVASYFDEFLRRWPNVEALAAASLDQVLSAWAGLGYYARARNLHRAAQVVAARGGFPDRAEELALLPGIGAYTAGAIAAIAFDRREAAVDGNVERVLARLDDLAAPLPAAKPALRRRALELVPRGRPGDFAQALMDLGATVCLPRNPRCALCPWQASCVARARGTIAARPMRRPKKERPLRLGVAFWAVRGDGAILLRRRAENGLLGGMLEVPSTPWGEGPPRAPLRSAPFVAAWKPLPGRVRHVFTHFALELEILAASSPAGRPSDGIWAQPEEIGALALPSLMRKVARHALRHVGGGSGRLSPAHDIEPAHDKLSDAAT
ncbi:MAG: A/G-specific adenine glycosylase [Alphaproteobacteria bacterium]|nr:A/G-specific adenine glycosylase [Alphaproteobacteria bacterium]